MLASIVFQPSAQLLAGPHQQFGSRAPAVLDLAGSVSVGAALPLPSSLS